MIIENKEMKLWGIHTQDENLFLKDEVIAIGWQEMGDLRLIEASRDAFKNKYVQIYPNAKKAVLLPQPECCIAFVMKYRSVIM